MRLHMTGWDEWRTEACKKPACSRMGTEDCFLPVTPMAQEQQPEVSCGSSPHSCAPVRIPRDSLLIWFHDGLDSPAYFVLLFHLLFVGSGWSEVCIYRPSLMRSPTSY